jgi:DNA-binding transcriptional ArsR family regulator
MEHPTCAKPNSIAIDDILEVVADPQRRDILSYLSSNSKTHCSVAELVDHLQSQATGADQSQHHLRARLHHVHLPNLQDVGLITYDAETQNVQYTENQKLESLLSHVASLTETATAASATAHDE